MITSFAMINKIATFLILIKICKKNDMMREFLWVGNNWR